MSLRLEMLVFCEHHSVLRLSSDSLPSPRKCPSFDKVLPRWVDQPMLSLLGRAFFSWTCKHKTHSFCMYTYIWTNVCVCLWFLYLYIYVCVCHTVYMPAHLYIPNDKIMMKYEWRKFLEMWEHRRRKIPDMVPEVMEYQEMMEWREFPEMREPNRRKIQAVG